MEIEKIENKIRHYKSLVEKMNTAGARFLSINDLSDILEMRKGYFYSLMKTAKIQSFKASGRTMVNMADVINYYLAEIEKLQSKIEKKNEKNCEKTGQKKFFG